MIRYLYFEPSFFRAHFYLILCDVCYVLHVGQPSPLTGEQAFSILRTNYVRLQESLPVNDILPELFARTVVTESEFTTLQDQPSEMKQRCELAKYLLTAVRRQQSNFNTLCDILLKTPGVEDLGKTLAADGNEYCTLARVVCTLNTVELFVQIVTWFIFIILMVFNLVWWHRIRWVYSQVRIII